VKTNTISRPASRHPDRVSGQHGAAQSHLVFEVASEFYACPINDIERLLRCADAEVRPSEVNAPSWEAGLLMDRSGETGIPIVSLRALWGLPTKGGQADKEALLVVRVAGQLVALLVDACLSVLPSLPVESARFELPSPFRVCRCLAELTIGHSPN
jgi:chemotaxis signal transduction protein